MKDRGEAGSRGRAEPAVKLQGVGLPQASQDDVWLTGYMLSSPGPLTSCIRCHSGSSPLFFLLPPPRLLFFREVWKPEESLIQAGSASGSYLLKGRWGLRGWEGAVTGKTKAIQVKRSELAWDSQAPTADNTEANVLEFEQSATPSSAAVTEGVLCVCFSQGKKRKKKHSNNAAGTSKQTNKFFWLVEY